MAKKNQPGCPCCSGSPCQICFHVTGCAGGSGENGVNIVVTKAGFTGSCTTATVGGVAGKCCVPVPATGTYDWEANFGSGPLQRGSVAVTCPGTTNVEIADVTPGTSVCVKVDGCNASRVTSVTTDSGLTVSNPSTGVYCVSIPGSGAYPHVVTFTVEWGDVCGGGHTATVSVPVSNGCLSGTTGYGHVDSGDGWLRVFVAGCCSAALQGATVTTSAGSATTDASGVACIEGAPGTPVGTVTVSKGRFTTGTIDLSGTNYGCALASITLDPAVGYFCTPLCPDPFKTSMTATVACGTGAVTGRADNECVNGGASWGGSPTNGCHVVANPSRCLGSLCDAANTIVAVGLTTQLVGGVRHWFAELTFWTYDCGGSCAVAGRGSCGAAPPCGGSVTVGVDCGPVDCSAAGFPLTLSGTFPSSTSDAPGCAVPCAGDFVFSE